MKNPVVTFVMIASGDFFFNSATRAQNSDSGKSEFQESCAACHGLDGEGNGPLISELEVLPANLTVLTKKNNGVFPFQAVYEVIDGQKEVAAHGTREMPIWGREYMGEALIERLSPEALKSLFPNGSSYSFDADVVVRTRILSLIDYLSRIQEK